MSNSQIISGEQLSATILPMDSVLFDAFNQHRLDVMKKVFADHLEFYQDRDGLGNYNEFKGQAS